MPSVNPLTDDGSPDFVNVEPDVYPAFTAPTPSHAAPGGVMGGSGGNTHVHVGLFILAAVGLVILLDRAGFKDLIAA